MEIIEVDSVKLAREFLLLPELIYHNEPNYIRPLDHDIEAVFDRKHNTFFGHGECIRWIVQDNGKTIGRIAAFIDHKTSHKNDQPTGGVGFFECVDNKNVAFLLFNTAKQWLMTRGMEAMDGPINFGERDKWWGLLIQGYEFEPNYCMNYQRKYYKDFFEDYGFKEYFQQYTYYRQVQGGIDDGIRARAERINKNGNYRFINITSLELKKVGNDFREIYNKAWASHPDAVEMTPDQVDALLLQIKPIMDKRLIWFGYYGDQPIAFAVMLPEVNQIFKRMNGKLGIWERLKFLYYLKKGFCTKMVGVAFGIVPRFQRKGVESAIIEAISRMAYDDNKTFNYTSVEHNWVGDFNPKMMKVHELMGGTIRKIHATYRYLFDPAKEFKRAPIVN